MNHWEVWASWGADPWVVEVLRYGYRLRFRVLPSLSPVPLPPPSYSPNSIRGIALHAVVADLHEKGAVEPAPSGPLLQSPLCHPQGHRGLEACDRSLTPQPFGLGLQVSHGDCRFGSPVSSSGGLNGVPGSPGRLPSGSSASVISSLPEVLCGGRGPTVSLPLLRSVDCLAGVHAGHGPCVCHHAPLRVSHPSLPGRLARPRLLVSGCSAGEGLSPLALPGARGSGEYLQELSGSVSDFGLSGDETSKTSFEGFPDPKAYPEALLSATRIHVLSIAAANVVATTSECHVVPVLHRSGVSAADALP